MTLMNNYNSELSSTNSDIREGANSSWDVLYCPHLWTDHHLRTAIINAPHIDAHMIRYCYTCKGKIRKYEIRNNSFLPNIHSTPNNRNTNETFSRIDVPKEVSGAEASSLGVTVSSAESNEPPNGNSVPTISRQVDASFRHKYISYERREGGGGGAGHRRLRKSLKGIGCVVSLALSNTSVKKRTQIQACSISVMIVAIVVISFVLVNFTSPSFRRNVINTNVVPTITSDSNRSSLAVTSFKSESPSSIDTTTSGQLQFSSTADHITSTESSSVVPDFIAKIRKNLKTYPKGQLRNESAERPKEINNRDLSSKFCSCQTNEVCMLDEISGTAICKKALDVDDPTGCGGLCALDTEACQLVDRARGVRVCRLLSLVTCAPTEWRCRNGLCIEASGRCDGVINCYDRSDEIYCDCDLTQQFRCGHSISCFPNSKLCDGAIDCWDGFDELNCTTECQANQSPCRDGQCILKSRFCDGFADCGDRSDEPQGCDAPCTAHEMRCANSRCVPLAARCDRQDNCGDSTDELACPP